MYWIYEKIISVSNYNKINNFKQFRLIRMVFYINKILYFCLNLEINLD